MAVVLIVQILFGWLIFSIIPGMRPASGGGVFLLFLLSQILFIIKLMLRAWRYGSVTSMLEQHP
jgi:membrane protein YdbS with pleckstrin-like domain